LGPEGGKHGGQLVTAGTPEDIAKNKNSVTGKYLKEKL
jgi:excinuclease ABC subunit A